MHLTEVSDVGHAAIFVEAHVHETRKDAGEGVVHPDVDRAPFTGDLVRRALDCGMIGNVGRNDERLAAELLDLARRRIEARASAREQRDLAAVPREFARRGATDARRCAGDDDHFRHVLALRHN